MTDKAAHRLIIGVVGRTFETAPSDSDGIEMIDDARAIGGHLTKLQHAILTGGSWAFNEYSVKYSVLAGATDVSTVDAPARLIGILPIQISRALGYSGNQPDSEADESEDQRVRYVHVHTLLASKKRDPITGAAADAVIALKGESGTPREVVAALRAGCRVIYLRSWPHLESRIYHELARQEQPEALLDKRDVIALDDPVQAVRLAVDLAIDAVSAGRGSTLRNAEVLRINLDSYLPKLSATKAFDAVKNLLR